jgi:glycosyltransferase involved in cell wall biosynthesis
MAQTATLCAIMKNERPYVLEWVAYHRVIGFDRILIYDNASTDGTATLLKRLAWTNVVEVIEWPDVPNGSAQMTAYHDALQRISTEWVAFLDADEFLNLHQDDTVAGLLSRVPDTAGALGINWRIFGSSGHQNFQRGLVMRRFLHCASPDYPTNRHIKSIARVRCISRMLTPHACELRSGSYVDASGRPFRVENAGFSPSVTHQWAQINHYVVKSRAEYEAKKARGRAAYPVGHPLKHDKFTDDFWPAHDRNEDIDTSILRFAGRTRMEILRLRATMLKPSAWLHRKLTRTKSQRT